MTDRHPAPDVGNPAPAVDIRPFTATDTDAVVSLWRDCDLTRPWNDPYKDIARKLQVQCELFLVATVEGVLAGTVMAGYDGHRGWINYLAVSPGQRRLGIARRLMAHVEKVLAERGCPKINLQIRDTNVDVIAFYEAIGYVQDPVVSMGRRLIPD